MPIPKCLRCGQILFPGIRHKPVFILEIVPESFPIKNAAPGDTYLFNDINKDNVVLNLYEKRGYIINRDYGKLSCI